MSGMSKFKFTRIENTNRARLTALCIALSLCGCSGAVSPGQKWGPFLQGFGFVKPVPEEFTYPGYEGFRSFPPKETKSIAEYKKQIDEKGAALTFNYEPDKTWIELDRQRKDMRKITFEQFIDNWVQSGHDIGPSRVHYVDAVGKPEFSTRELAGKAYNTVHVVMATNGDLKLGRYDVMYAERDLPGVDQTLVIQAYSPGAKVNMKAVETLLRCVGL
jgi:hypothetical protein